jgi:hypothetical protein
MLGERGTADAFRSTLYATHLGKSAEFARPRFGEELFNVKHYAAEISCAATTPIPTPPLPHHHTTIPSQSDILALVRSLCRHPKPPPAPQYSQLRPDGLPDQERR